MLPTRNGAFQIFRVFGIAVFVHWSWFIVAVWRYQNSVRTYSSPAWFAAEYVALFGIVLLHEFGHSLSCRQVGGTADQIVLWPLGGVAYVSPPQRPGAQLWSIAAGPLVNVVLFFIGALFGLHIDLFHDVSPYTPDWWKLLNQLYFINFWMLIFNLLPIYPLDGGQILRSLLWYVIGRARSLYVASAIGFAGASALAAYAVYEQSIWIGVMAFFLFSNCRRGWMYARGMSQVSSAPRRAGAECPQCHRAPPVGPLWNCLRCRQPFDPFASSAVCPACQAHYSEVWCLDCSAFSPLEAWGHAAATPARRIFRSEEGSAKIYREPKPTQDWTPNHFDPSAFLMLLLVDRVSRIEAC